MSVPRAQISSSFPILDHEITHVPLPTLIPSWPLVFAMFIYPKPEVVLTATPYPLKQSNIKRKKTEDPATGIGKRMPGHF